jgi:hypothetical protein
MTANEWAKKQGFKGARPIQPWNVFSCYEAVYAEESLDAVPCIGIPQIILEKGGVFRMADYDEAMTYISEVENA